MNISLTWANYALIVTVFLFVYYSIVLILFRKKTANNNSDLPLVNSSAHSEITGSQNRNFNLFGEEVEESTLPTDTSKDLKPDGQDFANEIEAYTSTIGIAVSKEELIQNLKRILRKHQSIFYGGARYELNQLILLFSENNCSIHLSEDELEGLWNG